MSRTLLMNEPELANYLDLANEPDLALPYQSPAHMQVKVIYFVVFYLPKPQMEDFYTERIDKNSVIYRSLLHYSL